MSAFTKGDADSIDITIDSDHATLAGIASQINAANAGLTASVVNDGSGARLVMKSATGADQAFTLSGTGGLSQLNVGVGTTGTTIGAAAQDALVSLDGVQFHRSSNQIDDLVDGVKLNLLNAQPNTPVTIGSTTPTDALSQAVNDFVTTYNSFHSVIAADLNQANGGSLVQDVAAKTLNSSMSHLTSTQLISNAPAGTPTTLAEIGVATNKDGSLTVNATQLAAALAKYPQAVEAMFSSSADGSGDGLANKLAAITNTASSYTVGLANSQTTYTAKKSSITDQQSKLSDQEDAYKTQLTTVYSAMNTQVSNFKSIGNFLTNQIAAWNKSS
jgi:flagellar hook-associated protein 2